MSRRVCVVSVLERDVPSSVAWNCVQPTIKLKMNRTHPPVPAAPQNESPNWVWITSIKLYSVRVILNHGHPSRMRIRTATAMIRPQISRALWPLDAYQPMCSTPVCPPPWIIIQISGTCSLSLVTRPRASSCLSISGRSYIHRCIKYSSYMLSIFQCHTGNRFSASRDSGDQFLWVFPQRGHIRSSWIA